MKKKEPMRKSLIGFWLVFQQLQQEVPAKSSYTCYQAPEQFILGVPDSFDFVQKSGKLFVKIARPFITEVPSYGALIVAHFCILCVRRYSYFAKYVV